MIPKMHYYGHATPLGRMTLMASEKGIFLIHFGYPDTVIPQVKPWLDKHLGTIELEEHPAPFREAIKQLNEYFKQERRSFYLPLDLYGTSFQKKVWESLRSIPFGETRTYKQIAEKVGSPKAFRAVGSANNKNPISIFLPCHRVIGSDGKLVGYGGGLEKKEYLLRLEKYL